MGDDGCWRITLLDADGPHELLCRAHETVLSALRPIHGRRAIAGCRNGGCGICRVRIVSGDYRVGLISRAHVSVAEQVAGFTLACRTQACSDLVLEIAGVPGTRTVAVARAR